MFYAIGEPEYNSSNWYRRIFNGFMTEKRQKRFPLLILESFAQLDPAAVTSQDAIFVIGTNSQWLEQTVSSCHRLFDNRVIVLANHENRFARGTYSIVTADITHSVQTLYRYLNAHGKHRIAMYGANPRSSSDAYRTHSFLLCGGCECDIFYNTVSLLQCFEDFSRKADAYDAVICVNDYAAISLVRHLPDYRRFFIASCGAGAALSDHFRPHITHAHIPYEAFARAGLEIYRLLQKDPHANSVNIYLASEFISGETTGQLPFTEEETQAVSFSHVREEAYYADQEISEMMRVEALLNTCDETDRHILQGILQGKSYALLAEELFMSLNGIKYKVKNMLRLCGVSTKAELTRLLNQYLSCDR